ncbi:aconitate hydratase [Candidatus Protochlamydia sp. R18]|uniref:aconitate hydratase n=1 Tax=Candidatus Protochlamydia sp. R18 TaxID=1353977 RepID=UPI0005AB9065|nr:aconitate hydratase [Candidatus Protochlamydia sp. R18]
MSIKINPFNTLQKLSSNHYYYSLPKLEEHISVSIRRLPISIRIMLESMLRHCDGHLVKEEDILRAVNWNSRMTPEGEIPFIVSRVILQDFTGVPLLVDLAAMRDAVAKLGLDAKIIEPEVPVDLVVDHSVQVDRAGTNDAFLFNLKIEFERNRERYSFLKWGQKAYKTFQVIPPGIGIVHQVNLEHIAEVVVHKKVEGIHWLYPDTLVGTDSHTTMINGLGVVGWGVGGIEAEAAMLGQPIFIQMPEVIGVHLSGELKDGVTATDLTLYITELLRNEKVVGKFVEFFGEGAASLTVADRATIGNMAPEYGATMGFFAVDDQTLEYLRMTGRDEQHVQLVKEYLTSQQIFGIPRKGDIDFTKILELDLTQIQPCVSGPKRPQDRIDLSNVKAKFDQLLKISIANGGYGKAEEKPHIKVHSGGVFFLDHRHEWGGTSVFGRMTKEQTWSEFEMLANRPLTPTVVNPGYANHIDEEIILTHGSIVIAAITSCTNTSNPNVMLAAGLLAKKAVEKGLKVNPMIKTSLAPGSRIVTDYLAKSNLQQYLDQLGFQLVAYGCTTCIGNSGPLDEKIEKAIKHFDLITVSVLSGNRNFEARIHGSVKANFLMSPPLVVAYALAGRIDIDLANEPIGYDQNGQPVYLKDLWPSENEIKKTIRQAIEPDMFKLRYSSISQDNPVWDKIITKEGSQYNWESESTYIRQPPYFENFSLELPNLKKLQDMRPLALFGDSVTTDHISPAGSFKPDSPAGKYLMSLGISEKEFNSYGSRRGNHEVMMRGTFANVRLRNRMVDDREGGLTTLMPDGMELPIFDACQAYADREVPLIIFAGKDYGMGSSRDWAAKGTALLGVRVVVARSFERIHRSNLIGMGILPLEFLPEQSWESLGIIGEELFSIKGFEEALKPNQELILEIKSEDKIQLVNLRARLETTIEVEYYRHGGILPYVLRYILNQR